MFATGVVDDPPQKSVVDVAAGLEIAQKIRIVRDRRVLLDSDLATLYGVKTHRLNEQVRRNIARFPGDFLLHLTN